MAISLTVYVPVLRSNSSMIPFSFVVYVPMRVVSRYTSKEVPAINSPVRLSYFLIVRLGLRWFSITSSLLSPATAVM